MRKRSNGGFTLIELIVAIAISTVVTAAALSAMMLGFKINAKTSVSIQQQISSNMLSQLVQTLAETPNIELSEDGKTIFYSGTKEDGTTFKVVCANYDASKKTIYMNGVKFMENVTEFSAALDDNTQLLTVTVKTNEKTYITHAYCRLVPTPKPNNGGTNQ